MMNWVIVCPFCYSALMLSFCFWWWICGLTLDNELMDERDDCSVMWGCYGVMEGTEDGPRKPHPQRHTNVFFPGTKRNSRTSMMSSSFRYNKTIIHPSLLHRAAPDISAITIE